MDKNEEFRWRYNADNVDWEELSQLYKIAPLGDKPAARLKTVFNKSQHKCFVYNSNELVGVGRAFSDTLDTAYICDVAVHPHTQGSGLGRAIVEKLVAELDGHNKIILYANPGKEAFYEKLGFSRMTTAMAIFANQDQAIENGLIEPHK